MAAPWLHTGFLLVLLATSCPGSRGTATQLLCGSHLVDALYFVCGEQGFRYMPKTDDNPVLRFQSLVARAASSGGQNEVAKFPSKDQMEKTVKRSITEQCCLQPCSLYDLQNYCV